MTLIQILVILFCLFAIWRVASKFGRRELRVSEFVMWLVCWIVVGVAFVVPDSLTYVANVLGIGMGADLVLYVMACTAASSCGSIAPKAGPQRLNAAISLQRALMISTYLGKRSRLTGPIMLCRHMGQLSEVVGVFVGEVPLVT